MSHDITYMWNLQRDDANELTRQSQTHRLSELPAAGGKDVGRVLRGGHVHTTVFKTDSQQGPTAQHRALCLVLRGGLDGGEWIGVCGWVSCSAAHLKGSQHLIRPSRSVVSNSL